METKILASFTIFCLFATVFITNTECTPLGDQAGLLDPLTKEDTVSQGVLSRQSRQYFGYPGYGLGLGGLGYGGLGGGSAASAAAAASSSSGTGGLGYPYGK